jgi:hypothetical protein
VGVAGLGSAAQTPQATDKAATKRVLKNGLSSVCMEVFPKGFMLLSMTYLLGSMFLRK